MDAPPNRRSGYIPLTQADLRHILDGDEDGGGHRYGAGKQKTEFPLGWDEQQITEISEEFQYRILMAHHELFEGKFEAVIHRVRIRMYIQYLPESATLIVATMFPLEGDGVTVWANGKRKPKPLREQNMGVTL